MNTSIKLSIGFIAAVVGAFAAQFLKIPLPWTLGPLLIIGFLRVMGTPICSSKLLRNAGQWVIGLTLGLYFTVSVIDIIFNQWLGMLAGLILALLLGVYGCYLLHRFGGVDIKTAWFSSAIGGANEMAILAERYGVRPDLVASAHTLRVILVVLTVPFICDFLHVQGIDKSLQFQQEFNLIGLLEIATLAGLGGYVAHRFRIPNAWVLGPMFVAMLFTLLGYQFSNVPSELSKVAQLCIGWSLGDRFRPGFFKTSPKFLLVVFIFSFSALVMAFGFSYLLALLTGLPLSSLAVSVAPGGIAEMAITAKVLQLGVPLVTSFQVFRMVGVVLLTGPIYQYIVLKYWPIRDGDKYNL